MEKEQSETQPPRLEKPVPITEQVWPEGTMPVVSVFNWAYNHAEFIRESIDSILMQETTFPVEIIVHDDASTDGTTEIIREYEAKYPQLFRNIIQSENQWSQGKNVMAAMLTAPRGQYVALSHGDDYWTHPLKLQRQIEILEADFTASGSFHAASIINEDHQVIEVRPASPVPARLKFNKIVINNYILTCSLVYRTSRLNKDTFFASRVAMGDWPLQICLAQTGDLVAAKGNMGTYRLHSGGVWSAKPLSVQLSAMTEVYGEVERLFGPQLTADFQANVLTHCAQTCVQALKERNYNIAVKHAYLHMRRHASSLAKKLMKAERKKTGSGAAAHSDKCNLGCGQHFNSAWDNYDCVLSRAGIKNIDLTKPLPFETSVYNACYLSHVLEHLPRQRVSQLLCEIFATLKPGGVIRVVVPDLETIARLYLSELETAASGDPSAMRRHEWMTLELIDQMTRTFSGGFMGRTLRSRPLPHREFIEKRTGWEVRHWLEDVDRSLAGGAEVLPSAEIYHVPQTKGTQEAVFRQSGEVHRWMYDRVSIKRLLVEAGFSAIKVCAADESSIPNFASYWLDTDDAGRVRKPDSLFVEAIANKHDSSCR